MAPTPKPQAAKKTAADGGPAAKIGSQALTDGELKQLKSGAAKGKESGMPAKEEKKSGGGKAAKKDKAKATSGLSLKYLAGIWLAVAAGALAIAVHAMQQSHSGEQLLPGVFSKTECHSSAPKPGARGWVANCSPRQCGKVMIDDFASAEEVAALRAIACAFSSPALS